MNALNQRRVLAEASDTKPTTTSGAARMREAARMILGRDCMEIAEALSKSSKKGQIQCAKLLYELSEPDGRSDETDFPPKTRSIAEELANAPQWTGDWPEIKDDEDDEAAMALQCAAPIAKRTLNQR